MIFFPWKMFFKDNEGIQSPWHESWHTQNLPKLPLWPASCQSFLLISAPLFTVCTLCSRYRGLCAVSKTLQGLMELCFAICFYYFFFSAGFCYCHQGLRKGEWITWWEVSISADVCSAPCIYQILACIVDTNEEKQIPYCRASFFLVGRDR